MTNKKIVISLIVSIIILIVMIGNVNAASNSFTFTVNPTQVTAKLGTTITVNLGIADIDQESNGINAIQGNMSYDEALLESVKIVKTGDWNISLNDEENNLQKGKFVMTNMNGTKEAGTVAILEARIKSDATVTTGTINLKNVCSSYGTTETEKVNKTITVKIEAEQDKDEELVPPANDNNNDNQQNEQKQPEKENKPVAPAQTTDKNTSNATKLPKAGLSYVWVISIIVVAIIGIVIGYIKYKKIY